MSTAIAKLAEKGYSGYTSYAAYARIFIPDVLQGEGRMLYLDGDTLVNGSFSELMQMDMQGCPFALSVDCMPFSFKKAINVPENVPYFNSGVMLMDLKAWRCRRCTERFLDELANPRGPNPLGDQDIFVRVFPGEIALMPPKWNYISHFFLFSYKGLARIVGGEKLLLFTPEAYVDAHKNPMVYHFGVSFPRPHSGTAMVHKLPAPHAQTLPRGGARGRAAGGRGTGAPNVPGIRLAISSAQVLAAGGLRLDLPLAIPH